MISGIDIKGLTAIQAIAIVINVSARAIIVAAKIVNRSAISPITGINEKIFESGDKIRLIPIAMKINPTNLRRNTNIFASSLNILTISFAV